MLFEVCVAAASWMGDDISTIRRRRRIALPSQSVAQAVGHATDVVSDIGQTAAHVCEMHEQSQFDREIIMNGDSKCQVRVQHPDRYVERPEPMTYTSFQGLMTVTPAAS